MAVYDPIYWGWRVRIWLMDLFAPDWLLAKEQARIKAAAEKRGW
jgi:hypothetical protein